MKPILILLAFNSVVAGWLHAEILYSEDFSSIQPGPLEEVQGWALQTGAEVEAQGLLDVASDGLTVMGGAGRRVAKTGLPRQNELYYGFDLTVESPPVGGGKVIASLLAGVYGRAGLAVAAPRRESTTFGFQLGLTGAGIPESCLFETGKTYRVVAGGANGGPAQLWAGETIDPATAPLIEVAGPLRGPFDGFAFVAQKGEMRINRLVIATTPEEAANPPSPKSRTGL